MRHYIVYFRNICTHDMVCGWLNIVKVKRQIHLYLKHDFPSSDHSYVNSTRTVCSNTVRSVNHIRSYLLIENYPRHFYWTWIWLQQQWISNLASAWVYVKVMNWQFNILIETLSWVFMLWRVLTWSAAAGVVMMVSMRFLIISAHIS